MSKQQIPNNVVPIASARCQAEGCKHKPDKAGFCGEHYEWFKEGLITKEGQRPKDFDKKYHAFMARLADEKSASKKAA
ncbi:MAG: hypothetical protein AB7O96_06800 [Pseudobdellovibrionaceae bacterium]